MGSSDLGDSTAAAQAVNPQSHPGESRLTATNRRKALNYQGFGKLVLFPDCFSIPLERRLKIALAV